MSDRSTDPLGVIEEALSFQRSVILSGETWTETCAAVESEALAALASVRERERLAQAVVEAAAKALIWPEKSRRWHSELAIAVNAFRAHAEEEHA